ncbi:hypothetical protein ACWDSJ_26155 [Nocardia sp. NPDC003482]
MSVTEPRHRKSERQPNIRADAPNPRQTAEFGLSWIELSSAATLSTFTVCNADQTIWHAPFHPALFIDTPACATEIAALQAIWLAGRARARGEYATVVSLRLITATTVDQRVLARAAVGSGLRLILAIDGRTNAARHPSQTWISWRDRDLDTLIHRAARPSPGTVLPLSSGTVRSSRAAQSPSLVGEVAPGRGATRS